MDKAQPVNLKLQKEVKKKFKDITHQQQTSMQSVLSAFVEFYIKFPEKIKMKMEIIDEKL